MVNSARGDTYKNVPSRLDKCGTTEDALVIVRKCYPFAYSEGSTGFQRSFWISTDKKPELVGHAWSTDGWFWRVRTFDEPKNS